MSDFALAWAVNSGGGGYRRCSSRSVSIAWSLIRTPILTPWVESGEVDADLRALRDRLAEITDLAKTVGVLAWDQKVTMPPGGHPARAEAMATVGRVAHKKVNAAPARRQRATPPLSRHTCRTALPRCRRPENRPQKPGASSASPDATGRSSV